MEVGGGHDGGLTKVQALISESRGTLGLQACQRMMLLTLRGMEVLLQSQLPKEDSEAGWRRWCARGPDKCTAKRPRRLMSDTKHLLIPWERVKEIGRAHD